MLQNQSIPQIKSTLDSISDPEQIDTWPQTNRPRVNRHRINWPRINHFSWGCGTLSKNCAGSDIGDCAYEGYVSSDATVLDWVACMDCTAPSFALASKTLIALFLLSTLRSNSTTYIFVQKQFYLFGSIPVPHSIYTPMSRYAGAEGAGLTPSCQTKGIGWSGGCFWWSA